MSAFKQIQLRELPTWVKVLKEDGITDKEEMLTELNLIDDLLTLQKSQSLLNRKRGLKDQLEARIAYEIGLPFKNQNTRKRK